jgi:hypothetical protein
VRQISPKRKSGWQAEARRPDLAIMVNRSQGSEAQRFPRYG